MGRQLNIKFGASPLTLQASAGRVWVQGAPQFLLSTQPPPTNFDYFISTTGSSSNPGTLAQPWDLNSINTKQSIYAGKRLGLKGGTYSLTALGINQNVPSFGDSALQCASGTSSNQTYIASCDNSGNYSLGAAILDCGSTLANNPNQGAPIGMSGSQGPNGNLGYVTLDGIEVKNWICEGIQFAYQTGVALPSHYYQGIVVQNCYVHAGTMPAAGSAGANTAGIMIYACNGAQILNNYLTDIADLIPSNGDQDPYRSTGIKVWTSINCKASYNTVYADPTSQGPCAGIDFKNADQWNNEISYNFVHLLNAASIIDGGIINSSSGGSSAFTGSEHHNIVVAVQPTESSDLGTDPTNDTCLSYANTWVGGPNWTTVGNERFTGAGLLSHWGSIYKRGTVGYRGDLNCNVSSLALSDFNWYGASFALGLSANGGSAGPTVYSSLASWAAALPSGCVGKDTHSLTSAITFANASGTGLLASDYQLPGTYGNGGTSAGANASRTNGQTGGTTCHMGAWDGIATPIGCNWKNP